MNATELMATAAKMSLPALADLIGLAALGAIVVAAICEWTARIGKRVLLDKYAQQTATMALKLAFLAILGAGMSAFPALQRFPGLKQWLAHPASPVTHVFILCAATVLLLVLWAPLWKKMRKQKGAHSALGLLAAVASFATIAAGTIGAIQLLPALRAENAPQWPTALDPFTAAMTVQYLLVAMASGAGLSLAYLVMRRNKDDFGRDYYRFGLSRAALWAFVPMVLQLGTQGWLFSTLPEQTRTMITQGPLGILWATALAASVLCIALWAPMWKSDSPLRLKWAAFLGALLLWIMHTANTMLFLNLTALV
ncbi:hypothetical protein [Desulfovibrio oxyclinae]|uniref:hypothetical protein n=1 Tax=Desulfovibrio oxyclinae TaxID=63560 RepID=UPI0003777657|nr:hypothetical protein [Desulfovibrio oxyclinae]